MPVVYLYEVLPKLSIELKKFKHKEILLISTLFGKPWRYLRKTSNVWKKVKNCLFLSQLLLSVCGNVVLLLIPITTLSETFHNSFDKKNLHPTTQLFLMDNHLYQTKISCVSSNHSALFWWNVRFHETDGSARRLSWTRKRKFFFIFIYTLSSLSAHCDGHKTWKNSCQPFIYFKVTAKDLYIS